MQRTKKNRVGGARLLTEHKIRIIWRLTAFFVQPMVIRRCFLRVVSKIIACTWRRHLFYENKIYWHGAQYRLAQFKAFGTVNGYFLCF